MRAMFTRTNARQVIARCCHGLWCDDPLQGIRIFRKIIALVRTDLIPLTPPGPMTFHYMGNELWDSQVPDLIWELVQHPMSLRECVAVLFYCDIGILMLESGHGHWTLRHTTASLSKKYKMD